MSQILAMAKQLQDAEQTIVELRRAAYEAAPDALHHSYAPTETEPVQSREVSRQFPGQWKITLAHTLAQRFPRPKRYFQI